MPKTEQPPEKRYARQAEKTYTKSRKGGKLNTGAIGELMSKKRERTLRDAVEAGIKEGTES